MRCVPASVWRSGSCRTSPSTARELPERPQNHRVKPPVKLYRGPGGWNGAPRSTCHFSRCSSERESRIRSIARAFESANPQPAYLTVTYVPHKATQQFLACADPADASDQAKATAVCRTGSAPITYGAGINFVNINGGIGNNTYNVSGTESGYTTTLNTGEGNDTVSVSGTSPTSLLVILTKLMPAP